MPFYIVVLLMAVAIVAFVVQLNVFNQRLALGDIKNEIPKFFVAVGYVFFPTLALVIGILVFVVSYPPFQWFGLAMQVIFTFGAAAVAYRDRKVTIASAAPKSSRSRAM